MRDFSSPSPTGVAGAQELSGDRIVAVYRIAGTRSEVDKVAAALCVEQTIEFPADLVTPEELAFRLIGQIEDVQPVAAGAFMVTVTYASETSGGQLPQLLNVLFGNISMLPGVRLADFELPDTLLAGFGGPRFGSEGLRTLFGVAAGPLFGTALKPMGTPIERLAAQAAEFAAVGFDMVKDDHSLASQPFSKFHKRVELCARAVLRSNEETGRRAIYVASLNVPADELVESAKFAQDVGAGGLLVFPGLHGFDAVRSLAADNTLGLPLFAHPSLLGPYVTSPVSGIAHRVLFGTLARLSGADVSIFPHAGGRFRFPADDCRAIQAGLSSRLGSLRTSLPSPAGGMTMDQLEDLTRFYGPEVMLLIGGDAYRAGPQAVKRALGALRDAANQNQQQTTADPVAGPA